MLLQPRLPAPLLGGGQGPSFHVLLVLAAVGGCAQTESRRLLVCGGRRQQHRGVVPYLHGRALVRNLVQKRLGRGQSPQELGGRRLVRDVLLL